MLISLTSVGVQARSASPDARFGSVVLPGCRACCKLDSRRDSICSWHARKQSCETHSLRWIRVTSIHAHLCSIFTLYSNVSAYRLAADELWQQVCEVLRGKGGIEALQIDTLYSCYYAASCNHWWRTCDKVDIWQNRNIITKLQFIHWRKKTVSPQSVAFIWKRIRKLAIRKVFQYFAENSSPDVIFKITRVEQRA